MNDRNHPCRHPGCNNAPLNESQREQGWKSCPECSVNNGIHIFYPVENFGYSKERKTSHEPGGIHSWCTSCRATPDGYKGLESNHASCDEHIQDVRDKHIDRSRLR
jgi:hypothetical protein